MCEEDEAPLNKQTTADDRKTAVYSTHYENEGTSSSVGDLDRYVVTRKLLDSTFRILPVIIRP
jgi:hypothetical protein